MLSFQKNESSEKEKKPEKMKKDKSPEDKSIQTSVSLGAARRAASFVSKGMPALFFLLLLNLMSAGAAEIKVSKMGKTVRLMPGDTLFYPKAGYRLKFNGYKTYRAECAVPGFNCGAGYFPGERVLPLLSVTKDDKCKVSPQPAECEVAHEALSAETTAYLDVRLLNVFDFCARESNFSNRTSCYIRMVRNAPYGPPYHPRNCEKITDSDELRDSCYEAAADALGDPAPCDLMKGPPGFQCVLLRARAARDPEICRTLKRNRFHYTEQDRLDQVASCIGAVGSAPAP